ncbi:unnamed protein product, partial [Urochloa humidicola]
GRPRRRGLYTGTREALVLGVGAEADGEKAEGGGRRGAQDGEKEKGWAMAIGDGVAGGPV